MPEDAALAVSAFTRGITGALNRLPDSEILMIGSQDLELIDPVVIKANEILQNIKKTVSLKNALKECVKLSILSIFIAAVLRLPLHKTVFSGSNGSGFGRGHVTHDADCVINEHRGDFLHVVPNLSVCFRNIGLLAGRGFQLYQYNRQAVQEQQDIRAFRAVLCKCPLIGDDEGVVLRIPVIRNVHYIGAHFAFMVIADFDAVLQIVHKDDVLLNQCAVLEILQLIQCILNRGGRQLWIQSDK